MANNKVTIPISTTTSNEINLNRRTLVGLIMPAVFTGTAITFLAYRAASDSFVAVHDAAGAAVSITVAADRHIVIPPNTLNGVSRIKLVSGSSEAAERVIELVTDN